MQPRSVAELVLPGRLKFDLMPLLPTGAHPQNEPIRYGTGGGRATATGMGAKDAADWSRSRGRSKRLLVGLAMFVVIANACSVPTPSASHMTTVQPSVRPAPSIDSFVGAMGRVLTIPGVAMLTVKKAREWRAPSQLPAAGYRFIEVSLTLSAVGGDLLIDTDALSIIDRTLAVYRPLTDGAAPQFPVPGRVRKGQPKTGLLTFEIPWGGDYTLRFSPSASVIGNVPLRAIASLAVPVAPDETGTPASKATATPNAGRSVPMGSQVTAPPLASSSWSATAAA
jgi:hypothetical protein